MTTARATTETEAANAALRILGVAPIADIAAARSVAARECRAAFGDARDETLRRKDWNFAAAWAAPAAAAGVAALGPLKNVYPIPEDCVRVRDVFGDGTAEAPLDGEDWAVETIGLGTPPADATVIVTNATDVLISYTRRIANVALWDPEFLAAFALRLAGKVAPPLSKEFTAGAELDTLADHKTDDAARSDAQERAPANVSRETSWITARR